MASKTGSGEVESFYSNVVPYERPKTWISAYFRPVGVFKAEKKKAEGKEIAKILLLAGLVSGLAWGIVSLIKAIFDLHAGAGAMGSGIESGILAFIASLIIYPLAYLFSGFVDSAIFYIFAKIFGGKGGYMDQTFGLSLIFGGMMVIGAPFVVLTVVPVLGTLFSLALAIVMIWGFYSQYRLIKEVHGLSTARAAATIIIPILILLALIAVTSVLIAHAP